MTYVSLSQDLLKQHFNYDPETGWFTWASPGRKKRRSGIAGGVNSDGYIVLSVDGKSVRAHRAAWVYVFGSIPNNFMIDHINGDRSDNRIRNLRVVTCKENTANRLPSRQYGMPRDRERHAIRARAKIGEIPIIEKTKTQVLKKEKHQKKLSRLTLMLQKNLCEH